MESSPKNTEYIGRISLNDKVGLYMDYSFLSVFTGSPFEGVISGNVSMCNKVTLMIREIKSRFVNN